MQQKKLQPVRTQYFAAPAHATLQRTHAALPCMQRVLPKGFALHDASAVSRHVSGRPARRPCRRQRQPARAACPRPRPTGRSIRHWLDTSVAGSTATHGFRPDGPLPGAAARKPAAQCLPRALAAVPSRLCAASRIRLRHLIHTRHSGCNVLTWRQRRPAIRARAALRRRLCKRAGNSGGHADARVRCSCEGAVKGRCQASCGDVPLCSCPQAIHLAAGRRFYPSTVSGTGPCASGRPRGFPGAGVGVGWASTGLQR